MVRTSGTSPVYLVQPINKTNQTNQLDGMLDLAAGGRTAAPASAIGRTRAETGEAYGDGGPFARGTADGNRAAMFFDDLLDCGETQPYAGPLRGEKRLKHLIDDFCWNRCPVVLNEDLIFYAAPRAMLGDLNMEMPTGVHRFACVFENTEKDLLELGFVTADRRDHRRIVLGHLDPCDFEVGGDNRERALDYFRDTEEPSSQLEWFRKVQNLVQDGFDTD